MKNSSDELLHLTNLLVEDCLTSTQGERLAELLRADPANVRLYVDYLELHGQLLWSAGLAPVFEPTGHSQPARRAGSHDAGKHSGSQSVGRRWAVAAAVLLTVFSIAALVFPRAEDPQQVVRQDHGEQPANVPRTNVPDPVVTDSSVDAPNGSMAEIPPLRLDNLHNTGVAEDSVAAANVAQTTPQTSVFAGDFSDQQVVEFINEHVRETWVDNGVQPSPRADNSEWLRRAFLTFAGRIPTLQETEEFLNGRAAGDRSSIVQHLADSDSRAANLAEIWSNLLVGRSPREEVDRDSLQAFLKDRFLDNRPWIDTVGELISAEGRNDQNGATNFLLAHLNNDATPATAVTARLFLGEQLQCVQCHDHPFDKGVSQKDYWALNAFFKQTQKILLEESPSADGSDGGIRRVAELIEQPATGMTHYETLRGELRAVLPEFGGTKIGAEQLVNRRQELVRLLAADSEARVARAMVNRMWAHFFSYGFTRPVDDIGPHVAVSHPELLDGLTAAFVESGYDLRRLMTWIALSEPWQLSSSVTDTNEIDDPDRGETPLFSRMYIRRMTPEQVYRSIRVAIRTAADAPAESIVTESESDAQHRRYWVAQFVRDYETDENDESAEFDGTVAQALVMMNGEEIDMAITQAAKLIVSSSSEGSNTRRISATDAVHRVAQALLTRPPTSGEQKAFRARQSALQKTMSADEALEATVEDMLWAYLNSSEFMLVH